MYRVVRVEETPFEFSFREIIPYTVDAVYGDSCPIIDKVCVKDQGQLVPVLVKDDEQLRSSSPFTMGAAHDENNFVTGAVCGENKFVVGAVHNNNEAVPVLTEDYKQS